MHNQKNIFKMYQNKWFFFFTGPALLVYTIFWGIPIFATIALSVTNWSGISSFYDAKFVGLRNYLNMLKDPIFRISLGNNLYFGLIMIVFIPVMSFISAYILDSHVPLKHFFNTLAYLPAVIPIIVTVLLWKWIFNAQYGILNVLLKSIGLEQFSTGWLSNKSTALNAVCAVSIWKSVPVYIILCLAGLQQVPKNLKEAAIIDGASELGILLNVTIPSMKNVLTTVLTLIIIDVFRVFELVYVMTNGGPGYYHTEMLLTYMYKTSFSNSMAGYGSAIGTCTILIVLCITAVQLKFSMKSNED
jgi:ABC-type sugar transport system permease subunit